MFDRLFKKFFIKHNKPQVDIEKVFKCLDEIEKKKQARRKENGVKISFNQPLYDSAYRVIGYIRSIRYTGETKKGKALGSYEVDISKVWADRLNIKDSQFQNKYIILEVNGKYIISEV